MNKNKLKSYAPQARKDFVAAVKARAALLGISEDGISLATKSGDIVIVEGREWPAKVGAQRERLAGKVVKEGFDVVMERVAYTWFNRFAALRYMELHDYLGHGHRVLSNREGGVPEILTLATDVDLPGLDKARVIELRLAGDRDGELYRMLLVAQCNVLNSAMPFLFERIDDESELLLPDNLLRTDSVVAKMVSSIDEDDWSEVEIIGWLYQFYISEKKDAVMGKVVKSEDIPAATQLFTPEWIVKYLVQNSVGRLWLMANPSSALRAKWQYYVEPAKQFVDETLALEVLVSKRVEEDGGKLNPESIRVLDPACGSGHILVEAYEVLKDIYLERGYQPRSIPHLILEHNIFGVDIDDRAAQLAGFALLMKARADDRRLFSVETNLHIFAIEDSQGLDLDELSRHLSPFGMQRKDLGLLLSEFDEAKNYGSLIQTSKELTSSIEKMLQAVNLAKSSNDVFAKACAEDLEGLLSQAQILSAKYDAVVANPPYMGGKGMNPSLKSFAKAKYQTAKADLFAMFINRGFLWLKPSGFNSMVTMQGWMFLSSFEEFREDILATKTIVTMAQLGPRAFGEISGEVVQTTAFISLAGHIGGYKPAFFRLVEGIEAEKKANLLAQKCRFDAVTQDEFALIPGSPIAYWVSDQLRSAFGKHSLLKDVAEVRQGLATSDNGRFVRQWHEVSIDRIGFGLASRDEAAESGKKWFPFNKGGTYRKWYGNFELVVNWESDGRDIKESILRKYPYLNGNPDFVAKNPNFYFKEGLSWSALSSGEFSLRRQPKGFIFADKGQAMFPKSGWEWPALLGIMNSKVVSRFLAALSPTLDFNVGYIAKVPVIKSAADESVVERLVSIHETDWNQIETSWDFACLPFVVKGEGLPECWEKWNQISVENIQEAKRLEEQNNRCLITAYGLLDEISSEVPEEQITLTRADRESDSKRLLSYAIGCMMGRYSLDEPGLVFANAGGVGFDPESYKTFPADADGILPLTDELWFEDDSTLRVVEFLRAVWGREASDENMDWLAESVGRKAGETAEETVRRYLSSLFYKDHLQTYKKRPVYWLFSSGKLKAFEALVYLHRYNEGTLARMRSEYVVPLFSKLLDRIELLGRDAEAASSAAARTKIQKRIDALRKKHHELVVFEEKLRHTADSRIRLDLDEGVKANYSKFGDLLAETKAITGGSED